MPLAPGATAPAFTLPAEPGGTVSLADLVDGRPAVLAFYRPDCPVCQMSFPVYGDLARRFGEVSPVVAVAQQPLAEARSWLDWKGFDGPALCDAPDYAVSRAYDVQAVPTMFLVGADGSVLDVVAGWDRDRVNALVTRLGEMTGLDTAPVSTENDGLPSYKPG